MNYIQYVISAISWSIIGFVWGRYVSGPSVKLMVKGINHRVRVYGGNRVPQHRRVR